jgi:hypothetical protein
VTIAVDLLLVLLSAAETTGLLIERTRLAVATAVDLLLVLLGAGAGLLVEGAGLAAVTGADLLLVLLRGLGGQGLCAHFVSCLFGRVVLGD